MTEDVRKAFGGGRVSAQRRAVAAAAGRMEGAFTVEDLAREAGKVAPGIGIATVYRAAAAMQESGFLEPVGLRAGSTLYVRCEASGHHHHLVCVGCGAAARTPCPLDDAVLRTAEEAGYVVTSHQVSIYVLCPSCAPGRGEGRGEAG